MGLSLLTAPAFAAQTLTAETNTIAEVQGTGATTPLAGQTVTVHGVVTADYRGVSNYRGIVIQTQGSGGATDATPGASDGIFVYLNQANPAVAIGDLVEVTGVAGENFAQTQITATSAANTVLVTAGVGVPEATALPDSVVGGAREPLESMLVEPTGTYLVSSSHQLFNFGTLWLNAGALAVKSTETTDAGPAADAIAAANRANRLLLDDGYSIQVTNANHPGTQPYFTKDTVVRNGDTVQWPANPYILSWGFDDWRLQPTIPINDASPAAYRPTFTANNPRPATPPAVGGDFSVAAFNVFNYFTTFSDDDPLARGAANQAQFDIQKSKIVAAINGLDANVVTLMEIENSIKLGDPVDTALADLVAGLNAAAGSNVWSYVPTPAALADAAATTDFITNAIIYKNASVTPVGASFADIDETVWDIAREPIAQTFQVDGRTVTVIANHFKSKSSPGGTPPPAEPADGQGFFNAERVEQANSVLAFAAGIAADPAKGPDIMMLGDFNSYAQEDPVQAITAAGFVDLLPARTDNQYSYTFDGELGSLDHAFASASLAPSITGVGVWAINAPEWSDRGYAFGAAEAGTPYRSSDHDPIKVGVAAVAPPVDIDIVSINDFHGRLEASAPAAGAAVLGGMVDSYRAANPNTLFVSAGDNIGASTFTSFIQDDQPTIDALNAIGLDASAFGNHEFDQGQADVDGRILPAADWPYLGANIYDKATGDPAYDGYSLSTVNGVTVGFIGAVTTEMPSLVSPAGIANLTFGDIPTAVNRVADELSDGNQANGEADVIVLLVHEGAGSPALEDATGDTPMGHIVNGVDANVDAIVSGHTHQAYNHSIPIPGTNRSRPVISEGSYGEKYGHMNLSVDPTTGELLSIDSEVLPLFGAFPPDPEVAQIVADAVAVAAVKGAVKVGEITADFNRAKQTATPSENRGGESPLGNFVADVQLWATQSAGSQIALMNPGGLRADLKFASTGATDPDGNLTYKEAAGVQPFANTLVTMDLTGAQLKQVLEEQWQPAAASRPFLKLGVSDGFKYSYDPSAPAGDRIDSMYLNGVLIDPAASYKVTVNSFLAAGGDNFTTLAQGANAADSGKVDLQSMVDYFVANPVASPDYKQRAVGVKLSAPEVAPGDSLTLDLSSLLFSNGEPNAGTAVVSAGGTELGSASIDPTIVDTTDEVGRASVTVTVPSDASGTLVLTVSVPETGTTIDVPVTVTAPPVEKIDSHTLGFANRLFVKENKSVQYTVIVTAEGVEPTGEVTIFDGDTAIATVTLEPGDHGRAKVKLAGFDRGIHLLHAEYAGSEALNPSSSISLPLLVY
jgi:5'-nucleotidase